MYNFNTDLSHSSLRTWPKSLATTHPQPLWPIQHKPPNISHPVRFLITKDINLSFFTPKFNLPANLHPYYSSTSIRFSPSQQKTQKNNKSYNNTSQKITITTHPLPSNMLYKKKSPLSKQIIPFYLNTSPLAHSPHLNISLPWEPLLAHQNPGKT